MSHVDEGALHAYLDGALDEYPAADAERIRAHLDGCAQCAERLEVERRIRSDAHAMLGLAAPKVEVPSFEELRAYVQRTRRQERSTHRLRQLGWAASIMVALGTGWMLRDGQLQGRALDIGQEMAPAAPMAPAGDVAPAGEAGPAGEAAIADEVASGVGMRSGAGATSTVGDAAPGRETGQAARRAAFQDLSDDAPGETPVRSADVTRVQANKVAETVAEMEAPRISAPLQESVVVADADALREAPAAGKVADVAPAPAVPVDAMRALAPVAADSIEARLAETEVQLTTTASRQREPASEPTTLTSALEARQEQGASRSVPVGGNEREDETEPEPLISVPGHEVLDVTNLGEGSTAWGVRVRQRMSDGPTFEVVHLEPGIDPAILPDLEAGMQEARAETGFGWVLVRGALPQPELEELLARLLPPAD